MIDKIMVESHGRVDEFELVDSVPYGYEIWCIGENMPEGYLPLIQPIENGSYHVNMKTMKAIKTDGARTILKAASMGAGTVKEAEEYIKKNQGKKGKAWIIEYMEKALPYMRQIQGL